jgi:aspartate racemase
MAAAKPFGVIGGLGPPSTVYYYNALLEAHAARTVPARLFIAHADLDHAVRFVVSGDRVALAEYLASLIRPLAAAGAEFVGMAAVTAHLCIPELTAISPIPVIDIIDVLVRRLEAQKAKRVAFLGNRFTMSSRLFGRLHDYDLIDLPGPVQDEVNRIYMSIVQNGRAAPADGDYLKALCERLYLHDGADAVISGGTEFSLVLREGELDAPLIDCAKAHVRALVERAISAPQGFSLN